MTGSKTVLGLVLAGGLSRRMGRTKSLVLLGGRPLLTHALERLVPQCAQVIVSDKDGATVYLHRYPIVGDRGREPLGPLGPLAGIEAGLTALEKMTRDLEWLASVSTDSPFLPMDLVERLRQTCLEGGTPCAIAASGGKAHPVIALWHRSLAADLSCHLHRHDMRRVLAFAERHGARHVEWAADGADPFFNINTPEDLAIAERRLALDVASGRTLDPLR